MLRGIVIAILLLTGVGSVLTPRSHALAAETLEIVRGSRSPGSTAAGLAYDGVAKTAWRTTGRRPPKRAWVSFDLGAIRSLSAIEWRFAETGFADRMIIQVSRDGASWMSVATGGNAPAGRWQKRVIDAEARHVRFWFTNPRKDRVLGSLGDVRLSGSAAIGRDDDSGPCQRIAVPAYFDPWTHWDEAIADAPATGLMILNPNSGVDAKQYQQHWKDVTVKAQAAGIEVIGYVITDLGKRPAAEVKGEIDLYFEWYGVDGIYLDNTAHEDRFLSYYRDLAGHVRDVEPSATVAMNPGWTPDERYMDFIDIMETFEFNYETYRTQQFPAWTLNYPANRFMHVVHSVPDADAFSATLDLAKERNAGYVFITDIEHYVNMYKSLGTYWDRQVEQVCT